MELTFTNPFWKVVAYDAGMIGLIAAMGYFPFYVVVILMAVLFLPATRGIKPIIAALNPQQRRVRFRGQVVGVLLLFALLARWVLRLNNGASWGIGSMAAIILFAMLYGEWDKLKDELCKRPSQSLTANPSPDPTSLSVTPPARQESRRP